MGFFSGGKDKDKKPAESVGDKSNFSLFKKPAASEGEAKPANKGRLLTLIQGQGAAKADAEKEAETPVAPSQQAPAQPAESTQPQARTAFSLKPRKAEAPVEEPVQPAQVAKAEPSRAPKFLETEPERTAVTVVPPVAEEGLSAAVEAPKKKGFAFPSLGGLFKSKAESKPKPVVEKKEAKKKEPVEKKPKTSGKATLGSFKDFHVYVQLENGKEFFWAVTANHVQEVDRKKVTRAASFSRDDLAIHADKAHAFKGAEDLALQEVGEPVHIVNRTKDLRKVYATSEERALTSNFRIFPGQQAIDKLVKDAKVMGKSVIAGFVFNAQDGKTTLCVLYYINADGLSTKPQVTLNPDNMDFVLNQFAASRKISRKDAEVLLFNNADFLGQVSGLQAYPEERVWRGYPVSSLVRAAGTVAVIGAGVVTAWAGFNYYQVTTLTKSISRLEAQAEDHRKQASTLISGSLYQFGKAMSLNDSHAFELAQQLWQPGSKLVMSSDLNHNKYDIKVPVVLNKQFNNRPSVDSTPMPEEVTKALNFEPPKGCTKDTTSVSGNLNEIQITVVCENPDSTMSGFRND